MSTGKQITVDGHMFDVLTEQTGAGWRVEVVNNVKSAFAFDPTFDSEAEAIAHASDALRSRDVSDFLG
ncbi:MAG: hypothetical protein WBC85_04790 [Planktotalea sp.]|uniref:hypothetical protein n=1 Tax=Planktotalea sp. TaxID=2029877 RepID=UPI003C7944F8